MTKVIKKTLHQHVSSFKKNNRFNFSISLLKKIYPHNLEAPNGFLHEETVNCRFKIKNHPHGLEAPTSLRLKSTTNSKWKPGSVIIL